jgi:hypothetical protein
MRAAAGREPRADLAARQLIRQLLPSMDAVVKTAQLFRIWSKPCGMYASVGGSTALEGRSSRTSLSITLTTRRTKKPALPTTPTQPV